MASGKAAPVVRWLGCVSNGNRLDIVCTSTLRVLSSLIACRRGVNTTMFRHTIKVITTGGLGLALSTTSIVAPPQPAVAAQNDPVTQQMFNDAMKALPDQIANAIADKKLPDQIANAIVEALERRSHHHASTPVEHTRYVVVEKPPRVLHRPRWCCRPPPPPPCPPGWGWY